MNINEKDKYYTPSIDEFHVGFEYEAMVGLAGWVKKISSVDDSATYPCNLQYRITDKMVRVKVLDQEDIQNCGWVRSSSKAVRFDLPKWVNGDIPMLYLNGGCKVHIRDYYDEETLFNGTIRNISELKQAMKMLGLTK